MLSDKDRELISIGASLAAGCQPCARFHLRAAQIAGASDAEINEAVNDALGVSRQATEQMAELARQYVGASKPDATGQANPLLRELVSISAASAITSISELEAHLAAARTLGATKGQILSAIKIASAVKGTAEGKVEEATGRAMEVTPVETESCCQLSEDWVAEKAVKAAAPAPERSDTKNCGPTCACHSETQKKNN